MKSLPLVPLPLLSLSTPFSATWLSPRPGPTQQQQQEPFSRTLPFSVTLISPSLSSSSCFVPVRVVISSPTHKGTYAHKESVQLAYEYGKEVLASSQGALPIEAPTSLCFPTRFLLSPLLSFFAPSYSVPTQRNIKT